ncbi:TrkH family potassium uptake protein [Treponema phagedenis]|uniref:Potassium transporter n=1 Tax=Treponema phagedenis TaxID=162 RepID=A0AAE6IUN6_TREPH|nr:potassium transporter [Treponema phagedenis]QEK04048.1 potassium transporter [Treponema phagedenis]QEK09665.1 potassium transporter [Treponema phagedenis]
MKQKNGMLFLAASMSILLIILEEINSFSSVMYIAFGGNILILLLIGATILLPMKNEKYAKIFIQKKLLKLLTIILLIALFVLAKITSGIKTVNIYTLFNLIKNIFLLALVITAIRGQGKISKQAVTNPAQTLILSFLTVIIIGAYLLKLPISSSDHVGLSLLSSLFTATSAVCVTGSTVINVAEQLSGFGKLILILLIQIGGLGFMVLSFFGMLALRRKLSLQDKLIVSYMINEDDMSDLFKGLKVIIIATFTIEAISAFFLFFGFMQIEGFGIKALAYACFHAVSAFCNAGFSLYPNNMESFTGNYIIGLVIPCTIILGGISFVVISEMAMRSKRRIKNLFSAQKKALEPMSLNTYVVLKITAVVLIVSFSGFYLLEHEYAMKDYGLGTQYLASFFQAVTLRTAGFSSLPFGSFRQPTLFFMVFIMFLGGASGSTAGGIKLNTIAAIIASFKSFLKNEQHAKIRNMVLHIKQIEKAFLIFGFGLSVVCVGVFCLSITERFYFLPLLFETVSAFATVGLSTGITPELTVYGQLIIIVLMFIGRVGPLTILTAVSKPEPESNITYAYSSLAIG